MQVNFFEANCQETTSNTLFGICDDTPPPYKPAYLNFDTTIKPGWIAEVENHNALDVTFTAIDNCIVITRPNGELESRCEGMLTYDNSIIFLELKDRDSRGWLGDARDQLITTINIFIANHDTTVYRTKRAHIANAQRPYFNSNFSKVIQEIDDACGFITSVQTKIAIT